jgi:hypothetical protein
VPVSMDSLRFGPQDLLVGEIQDVCIASFATTTYTVLPVASINVLQSMKYKLKLHAPILQLMRAGGPWHCPIAQRARCSIGH